MAELAPTLPPIFKGESGAECENFVRAVRAWAFEKGKHRNNSWMADFAATRLDGEALRWFEVLDPEVQEDWVLLRKAMLKQYPRDRVTTASASASTNNPSNSTAPLTSDIKPQCPGSWPTAIPTPDAPPTYAEIYGVQRPINPISQSPSRLSAAIPMSTPLYRTPTAGPRTRTGRIAIYFEEVGFSEKLYICKNMGWFLWFYSTFTPSEALHVQYTPDPGLHAFAMLNCNRKFDYMGITWDSYRGEAIRGGSGSDLSAEVVGVNGIGPVLSTSSSCRGESRARIWHVGQDGQMGATWIDDLATTPELQPLWLTGWLRLVFDGEGYRATQWTIRKLKNVRFVFEDVL